MKITLLGTGTSQGVPVIACPCEVCQSEDPKDKRTRVSVQIEVDSKVFVIDTGPDFRQQMLNANTQKLNAVIFTHEHKDHTAGLDDVRAFNFFQKKEMPVYGHPRVLNQIKREFSYAFEENKYPGIPQINLIEIDDNFFEIEEVAFHPIKAMHHLLPVYGYRIGDFGYVTDANFLENEELEKLKGLQVLVLNALRKEKHLSHFNLEEALEVIAYLKPQKAFLTHISHQMGKHAIVNSQLPPNVFLAYDGLEVQI